MAYIVRYIDQRDIDLVERLKGQKLSAAAIERMKSETTTPTLVGAINLVEHFRSCGFIASYYQESEL